MWRARADPRAYSARDRRSPGVRSKSARARDEILRARLRRKEIDGSAHRLLEETTMPSKSKLKIKSVTYRTNTSVAPYRTKHVEATADVGQGDSPERVLRELARFVHKQLGLKFEDPRVTAPLRSMGDE